MTRNFRYFRRCLEMTLVVQAFSSWLVDSKYTINLVENRNTARKSEEQCHNSNFEGLAILSTPEEFNFALGLIKDAGYAIANTYYYIGLIYSSEAEESTWWDGTAAPVDLPWRTGKPGGSLSKPWGNLFFDINSRSFKIKVNAGIIERMSLCGNSTVPHEIKGHSYSGYLSVDAGSILNTTFVSSYLRCVSQCRLNIFTCRAAEFHLTTLRCKTYGSLPADVTKIDDVNYKTFVRLSFSDYPNLNQKVIEA